MPLDLRVFISSPGDVGMHRDTLQDAIEHINNDPLVADRARLTAVRWDRAGHALPLSAQHTPQWSISEHLPTPGACDLTIALFWGRIGTRLPPSIARADGSAYPSGTAWEIEDALAHHKPVWIYRKNHAPAIELDDPRMADKLQQFKQLDTYLGRARNADGSINFGVNRFDNDEELRALLAQHLRWFIHGRLRNEAVPAAPAAVSADDSELHQLARYPIGPMIRDIVIGHLAASVAELLQEENPKTVFARVNARLAQARRDGEPELRLSTAMFGAKGPRYYWEDVLYLASTHGPRMLAAVLGVLRPGQLEGDALAELLTLIKRINSYVE